MLIPQRKERAALRIHEFLAIREAESLALASHDLNVVLVHDVEAVSGERPDFLLHGEGGLLGGTEGCIDAERRMNWREAWELLWHIEGCNLSDVMGRVETV